MANSDTKTCPDCQSEISAKAKKCPHCRKDLRNWFAKHPILTIIGGFFLFSTITNFPSDPPSEPSQKNVISSSVSSNQPINTPTPPRRNDFIANVSYDGTQFTISNLDDLECINAKMELNGGFFKDGFTYEGYTLESGETYTVGAMRFVNKSGEKFNPFTHQPLDIFIECQGNNELQYASYLAQFK